jgi:arginase
MGAGPEHLVTNGLPDAITALGHSVDVERLVLDGMRPPAEIRSAFELMGAVAVRVANARRAGAFPLILSGNCNTAVGSVAGLGAAETGVVWFDSHGDFNTPETTTSGFLDGMALAMLTGRCWRGLMDEVPGFTPIAEDRVVLVGARDLDPPEADALARSRIVPISATSIRERDAGQLSSSLGALSRRVQRIYVHIDLDVLDPAAGRANAFAAADGLMAADLEYAVRTIGRHGSVAGAALTAYDPTCDADGRVCEAALDLLGPLMHAAAR